jgi:hypothetical protein
MAGRDPVKQVLDRAATLVEAIIGELQLKGTEKVPAEQGQGWAFTRGASPVYVFLSPDDGGVIQVVAPVMPVPASGRAALFRRLLELNAEEVVTVGFGLTREMVVLTADRPVTDLDRAEVREMILRVGHYADHFRRELLAEFGGGGAC